MPNPVCQNCGDEFYNRSHSAQYCPKEECQKKRKEIRLKKRRIIEREYYKKIRAARPPPICPFCEEPFKRNSGAQVVCSKPDCQEKKKKFRKSGTIKDLRKVSSLREYENSKNLCTNPMNLELCLKYIDNGNRFLCSYCARHSNDGGIDPLDYVVHW